MESAKWPLDAVVVNAQSFMSFDIGNRYSEITVPALIVHGDVDFISPLDPCGLGLDQLLPDSRLEVIAGVRHCPAVEAPDRATELIAAHLERCFA